MTGTEDRPPVSNTPRRAPRLPISNRYVFAKVMRDNPTLCKELIETILKTKVGRIEAFEVESEATSIVQKSVCVDVFLEGDEAAFAVEMQAYDEGALPLRMRYYRSLIDRRLLRKGSDYADLKPVYILFICTNDPFNLGLPVYTFRTTCEEDARAAFDDRATCVALNAGGDLSLARPDVAELLQYVRDGKASHKSLPYRLQQAIEAAYDDEEWVRDMITVEDDLRDARRWAKKAGRDEGLAEGQAAGQAKGRAEGIAGAVALLRKVAVPDAEIRRQIKEQYALSDEEVGRYLAQPA